MAGRRARPAGVTRHDRGASGLPGTPAGRKALSRGRGRGRLVLGGTAARARQVRSARAKAGACAARVPLAEAPRGRRPRTAPAHRHPGPALRRSRRSRRPPRPSANLGAALQPQPKPELPERGPARDRPPCRDSGSAGCTYLPRRRARRAPGGSCWSALGAGERAPPRLFPRTPPGGVGPAGLRGSSARGHPASRPAPGTAPAARPHPAPCSARAGGAEPEAQEDRMGMTGSQECGREGHPSSPLQLWLA